jgi:large repetitive protein
VRKGTRLALLVVAVVVILAVGAVSAYAALADDTTAPVTTSDAVASYWNSAAIELTATDAEGVAYIYYRIDGGITRLYRVAAGVLHTTATISDAGDHTIAFWAQDTAGNVETHKQVALTVRADKAAPVTSATGAVNGRWYKATVPVALAAVDETDGSGVAAISYSWDAAPQPTVVLAATADAGFAVDAATVNGPHVLSYWAGDVAGNVETAKTLTVNIDTVKPTTSAPYVATATRGKTATLKYKVTDASPSAGKATVVIKVKNSAGKVVKTLNAGLVGVGTIKTKSFAVPRTWKAGTYKFYVYATDVAGNAQAKIGYNKLVVK